MLSCCEQLTSAISAILGRSWRLAAALLSMAQAVTARVVQMDGLLVAFHDTCVLACHHVPMR